MQNLNWMNARSKKAVSARPAAVIARAYIRHLLKAKEMLGMRLCVLHNLYYYNHLMEDIREAIEEGRYARFKKETLAKMEEKED